MVKKKVPVLPSILKDVLFEIHPYTKPSASIYEISSIFKCTAKAITVGRTMSLAIIIV